MVTRRYWEVHETEFQLGSQELKSLRASGMRAIYTQVTAHVSYESEEGKHVSGHSLIVHDSMVRYIHMHTACRVISASNACQILASLHRAIPWPLDPRPT